LVVGGVIGWMAWERQGGDADPEPAPAITVAADSARPVPVPVDSPPPPPPLAASTPATTVPPVKRPVAALPRTVRVEVTTLDSAVIYVDNRQVGVGRWSADVAVSPRLSLRAVVPDAPTTCRTALHDTVLTGLKAGQRLAVDLPVRGCAVVRYRVEPRDARVQFVPVDGGRAYETRADSVESYSLPWGRYLMRISAPYCIVFSDTVVVNRRGGDAVVPRKLVCS
ncbi:MAG: hypothetical protein ACK5HM_13410, partial [Gemmatimonas sp.]